MSALCFVFLLIKIIDGSREQRLFEVTSSIFDDREKYSSSENNFISHFFCASHQMNDE